MNLPLVETGAVVVAWTVEQAALLDGIAAQAHRNGTDDARVLDQAELRRVASRTSPRPPSAPY